MPEAAVLVADEPVLLRRGMTSAEYFAGEETMIPHNLIDGDLYRMPSPRRIHQDAVSNLHERLKQAARAQGGDVILSPMDCELADGTVLQPDLGYIIPERAGIYTDIVRGPPDIVIEVISPSSRRFQRERKMAVYARFGVPEAWVVDPPNRTVTVFENQDGAWARETTVAFGETIPSRIVDVGDGGLG